MDKVICTWNDNSEELMKMLKTEEGQYYVKYKEKIIFLTDKKSLRIHNLNYENAIKQIEMEEDKR